MAFSILNFAGNVSREWEVGIMPRGSLFYMPVSSFAKPIVFEILSPHIPTRTFHFRWNCSALVE
jgi:hypothetical protein